MASFCARGIVRFILSTLPLLGVLFFFLFKAAQRGSDQVSNVGNQNYYPDDVISLMDMMIVFLCFHVTWTLFTVYVTVFIPKRRHFLGRYLTEGQASMGDVIYDKTSRRCCRTKDYGYAIYPHPTVQQRVIRKRVRVYQRFTQERVAILRLPNRPLSGQPKVDIEIDLNRMARERDSSLRFVSVVAALWALFALSGAAYVLFQINFLDSYPNGLVGDEDATMARRVFLVVIGANLPFALAANWVRFLLYRNWMVNRGAIVGSDVDARKIETCLGEVASTDGSDQIPYSILGEEHSYVGTLPSHSGIAHNAQGGEGGGVVNAPSYV